MPSGNPSLPPAKKRKIVANQGDNFERIQHLEKLLLEAVSQGHSLNTLVDLLDAAKGAADPHLLFKCIYALYRVFASIIDSGMLVSTPDTTARVVRTWISERLNIFTDILVGLMSDSEKSLRVSTFQSVRYGYQTRSLDIRDTNPIFPPQALVIFFILQSGCPRTLYFF
jgi:hypothetical protein